MRDGGPIDPDVLFITESNELPAGELCAIVCDGVWYSKAMDDVEEEQHSLLGVDHGDRSRFDPFRKLVYGDKQVGVSSGRLLERSNQIEPPDREGPCDGDHLECLGQKMNLLSIVLTPFAGAYDLLGVGYCSGPVEALSECVSNHGPRCGMVTIEPTVDVVQQKFSLFARDTELQDPDVTLFVEFALYKNEGLGTACEPFSFRLIHWQSVVEEVVEVECSPVVRRVGRRAFFKLHDLGVR